ncbi:hypothetical protein WUBG_11957, partial [Wuchereria bancrofti]
RNGGGNLQTAESSNENLCDHPAKYPVSRHTKSEAEADPEKSFQKLESNTCKVSH